MCTSFNFNMTNDELEAFLIKNRAWHLNESDVSILFNLEKNEINKKLEKLEEDGVVRKLYVDKTNLKTFETTHEFTGYWYYPRSPILEWG